MRIDSKAEYYVGRPAHSDPTTKAVFGNPALKPEEDWGWLKPARPLPPELISDTPTGIPPSNPKNETLIYPKQITYTQETPKKKVPTEVSARLTALQTDLARLRTTLGRKYKHDEEVRNLQDESQRLARIRRKEKARARREVSGDG